MGMCECGCGHELGTSPSMYFRFDVCQTLWMLSQSQPEPQVWRERQREAWIFVSHAPYWQPGVLAGDVSNWEIVVCHQYSWSAWADLHPGEEGPPSTWLPTIEQALPYLIRDWYSTYGPDTFRAHMYGEALYKPKFFTLATV